MQEQKVSIFKNLKNYILRDFILSLKKIQNHPRSQTRMILRVPVLKLKQMTV